MQNQSQQNSSYQPFSVLLSVYAKEHAAFMWQALESVFCQTVVPDEVVLVEDGPLTAELDAVVARAIERWPQLKVVALAKNQGLGRALNVGLKYCTHPLVARMDTDDVARPNRFEQQLKAFATHKGLSVCGGWISEFDTDSTQPHSYRRPPESHEAILRFGKKRNPVNHMTAMFRKDDVVASGGYQDFPLFEDYYLWVRMIMRGYTFVNLPEVLVDVRADRSMIGRRGGWNYALVETRLQFLFHRMHYISYATMWRNILVRFTARMMPLSLRRWLYKNKLRHEAGAAN